MYPVKGIYFSLFLNMVAALSLEEATENLRTQMKAIAKGNQIEYNTTMKDKQFLTLIKDNIETNPRIADLKERPRERSEYRCLERDQRRQFHDALNILKKSTPEGFSLSAYDLFVRSHNTDTAPNAHYSPAFLLWHRHYLRIAERKVQEVCPGCKIPYWDSRLDRRAVLNGKDSVMFTEELVGNGNGVVVTGFAKNWTVTGSECMKINKRLSRNVDENTSFYLSDKLIETVLNSKSFKDISYPWNDEFEYLHGLVHSYIGGHMAYILCSPNDPVFFLHHCMVDNVFEMFKKKMYRLNKELTYDTEMTFDMDDEENVVRILSAPNHRMAPFNVTILYGLINEYEVRYEKSPADITCVFDKDCCGNKNTEYIFCDSSTSKCMSKLAEGALLRPNFPVRACYCPSHKSPFLNSGRCACK